LKHEYSDTELAMAWVEPALASGERYPIVEASYLRAFLDALPDQPDEWERCTFDQIRKGDRVRAEFIDITYEGTAVDVRDYKIAIGHNHNEILRAWKNPDLYRIPVPIVHPDPEVNHFIRINGKDYEAIPDSGRYQLIESKWSSPMVLNVEHITEWEELELIPKVVEDE